MNIKEIIDKFFRRNPKLYKFYDNKIEEQFKENKIEYFIYKNVKYPCVRLIPYTKVFYTFIDPNDNNFKRNKTLILCWDRKIKYVIKNIHPRPYYESIKTPTENMAVKEFLHSYIINNQEKNGLIYELKVDNKEPLGLLQIFTFILVLLDVLFNHYKILISFFNYIKEFFSLYIT